jgi:hypothetical protein
MAHGVCRRALVLARRAVAALDEHPHGVIPFRTRLANPSGLILAHVVLARRTVCAACRPNHRVLPASARRAAGRVIERSRRESARWTRRTFVSGAEGTVHAGAPRQAGEPWCPLQSGSWCRRRRCHRLRLRLRLRLIFTARLSDARVTIGNVAVAAVGADVAVFAVATPALVRGRRGAGWVRAGVGSGRGKGGWQGCRRWYGC